MSTFQKGQGHRLVVSFRARDTDPSYLSGPETHTHFIFQGQGHGHRLISAFMDRYSILILSFGDMDTYSSFIFQGPGQYSSSIFRG